ncbi:MAG: hypothetical protein N4A49_15790 [Marinifilaceae bacterium]|jgi:hypothetical protein|nr:hypothetical protein [Marinifilaceae bacterium]
MTHKLLKVDIHNPQSIQQALAEFKAILTEVYKTGELINKVPAFVPEDKSLFENADFFDFEIIQKLTRYLNVNDPDIKQMDKLAHLEYEQLNRPDYYSNYSHILVFQHALEQGLKNEVLEICEEMIAYSMKVDSSNELFFFSDMIFGIGILTVLGLKHPEYIYMIAEYLPRHADYNQIKYHFVGYVYFLFKHYGMSDEMIKMFARVKFDEFFIAFDEDFSEKPEDRFNLFKLFLEDKSKYDLFKKEMVDSFRKYPQNIFDDFDEDRSFAFDIIEKLTDGYDAYLGYEENEDEEELNYINDDFEDFDFHGTRLEDVVEDLHSSIFEAIKDIPRNQYYYKKNASYGAETLAEMQGDKFYEEYEANDDHEINNEFYLKGFENGAEILHYIETGENPEVLDSIEKTHIRKLALEKKMGLYKRLDYYGSGDMRLSSNLEQDVFLDDILESFVCTYLNADSYDLEDQDEYRNHQKAIRVLDVFVKITGKDKFSADDLDLIVENLELMSEQEVLNRYANRKLSDEELEIEIYRQVNDHFTHNLGTIKLRSIHRLYQQNPELFANALANFKKMAVAIEDPDILAVSPGMNQTEYALATQLLSVGYVISQEMQDMANMNNPHLRKLIEYYQENIFKTIFWKLEDNSRFKTKEETKQVLTQLLEYVEGPKMKAPPKEIIAKLMKGGMDALNEEEKKIMQSFKPGKPAESVSKEQANAMMQELFWPGEEHEEIDEIGIANLNIKKSTIYHSDSMGMCMSSLLYVAKVAPTAFQKQLLKCFELVLETAPVKTLYRAFKDFIDTDVLIKSNIDELNAYEDLLLDLKIDRKYVFAFQILLCQKQFEYKTLEYFEDENELKRVYMSIVDQYVHVDEVDEDESPMFAGREKARKQALKDSLAYLDLKNRMVFLSSVNQQEESEDYRLLILEQMKDSLFKLCFKELAKEKSLWEMNKEEKEAHKQFAQKQASQCFAFIKGEISIEELKADTLSLLPKNEHFFYAELAEICYKNSEEAYCQLLSLVFDLAEHENIKSVYEAIYNSLSTRKMYQSVDLFHQLALKSNIDQEQLYLFYLTEYKEKIRRDYEDNFFAQILLKNWETVQQFPKLKELKAYVLFEKNRDGYLAFEEDND